MKKNLLLLIVSFLVFGTLFAQTRAVKGKVTDSRGEALVGVGVMVKDTTLTTTTNMDGEFSIPVSNTKHILVIKYIGMKTQEIDVSDKLDVNVKMEDDSKDLNEVIVTAIGIKREKKALGYAVQDVSGESVTKTDNPNMVGDLGGKIAGVQVINSSGSPGGSAFIKLRGTTSITGNNQPLIVVDGVPFNNSENDDLASQQLQGVGQSNRSIDLNPDDIESITVLKGPAAAALYGTSASSGALVITTKKGTKAGPGKKVNVVFSSSLSLDRVSNLPQLQYSYAQGSGGKYIGPNPTGIATSGSWGPKVDTLFWDGDPNYLFDKHGKIVGKSDPSGKTPFAPYHNMEDFFQTGISYDNSLALSGGSDNGDFRLSASNFSQSGVAPLSNFKRTTVKLSGDQKLSNKIKTSASIAYSNSGGKRTQQGSNISGVMLGLLRTPVSFDDANGTTDPTDPSAFILGNGSGNQRTYRGIGGYDNPYFTINRNVFQDKVNRVFGYGELDYSPLSWLNVTYRLGTDLYNDRRNQYFAIHSAGYPTGRVIDDQIFNQLLNSDLLAIATKSFGADWNTSLIIGNNLFSENSQWVHAQGDGFNFPDFYNISNVQSYTSSDVVTRRRRIANYADAKIDYKSMLYLDLTGRQESSSTLPVNNNTYFYPSASLSFVFTEALKMNTNKILPFGKLRISFAQVGKDADAYSLERYYQSAVIADGWTNGIKFPFNNIAGFITDPTLGNKKLKPEKTNSFEAGTELRFFQNKIGLDVTYYKTTSVDQILPVSISPSTGFTSMIMNSGSIENHGLEVTLTATPVKTNNFKWNININWSRNRNKVISLSPGVESLLLNGFDGGVTIRAVVGKPYGQIYGGGWMRDVSGKNILIEDDINSADFGKPIPDPNFKVIGDVNPKWLGGMNNTFTYKRITAGFLINIRHGGDMWNGTKGALTFIGTSALSGERGQQIIFNGVKKSSGEKNDITTTLDQSWFQGNGGGFGPVAEQFLEDGSFIRLSEVSIGYDLNPDLLSKVHIIGLTVSVFARNLWLHTKYDGVDPETSLAGANNAQGMDYFNAPGTKTYGAKLSVRF